MCQIAPTPHAKQKCELHLKCFIELGPAFYETNLFCLCQLPFGASQVIL